jgi:hypothetical protein
VSYALRIFNRLACIGGPRSRVRSDATDIAEEAEAEIASLRADLDRECNAGAKLLAAWTESQARCAALEEALHSARPYVAHAYECSFPDGDVNASVLRAINAALFPADVSAEGPNP